MISLNNKTTKKTLKGYIKQNFHISKDIYYMEIYTNTSIETIQPGNFISILCEGKILRRPFSIAGFDKNIIKIIYKIKGDGTRYLSKLNKNDFIDLIGPLGNSFNYKNKKSLLVGAGVGIAPMKFLADKLIKNNTDYKILAGMQENFENSIIFNDYNLKLITNDGSSNYKGTVIDFLENEIKKYKPEVIYTCGPNIVMKKVCEIALKYEIPVEVAMEREFACGVGACMGCIIEIFEDNKIINKSICKDGPVFSGEQIKWD